MGKRKHTQESVEAYFKEKDCVLLGEYEGARTPMEYECSCGNISKISLDNFQKGKRCNKCGRQKTAKSKTTPLAEIQEEFNRYGCNIVDYKGTQEPITLRCKCGKIDKTTLYNFRRLKVKACFDCRQLKASNPRTRWTIEKVKDLFEEGGCELLEDEYKNSAALMQYRCNCGEASKISLSHFMDGSRCYQCRSKKISEKVRGEKHGMWNPDREYIALRKNTANRYYTMLKNCLDRLGKDKLSRTEELLGYTAQELYDHLHKDVDFENFGESQHIDHIFPIKAFVDYGLQDNIKLVNCLENLRLIDEVENLSKSGNYDEEEFEGWLSSKEIVFEYKLEKDYA